MQPVVRSSKHDFVVIVKPEAIKLTYQELKREVKRKIPDVE